MSEKTSESGSIGREKLEAWLLQNIRLTLFIPESGNSYKESNWWQDVTGDLPEKQTSNPREGGFIEQGAWGNGMLTLTVGTGRIDWRWEAILDESKEIMEAVSIGSFVEELNNFLLGINKWLNKAPNVKRLAFGAILFLPVSDQITGYKKLASYLPFIKLDPNSSDFFYSINRPRASKLINDLGINRLTKWSVGVLSKIRLDSDKIQTIIKNYACRVELDINTKPEYKNEISNDKISPLFQELIDLGKEILKKGDLK